MLALISGKPPQIRPANSVSLSLIVAEEDDEGEGKCRRDSFWHRRRQELSLPQQSRRRRRFFSSFSFPFS